MDVDWLPDLQAIRWKGPPPKPPSSISPSPCHVPHPHFKAAALSLSSVANLQSDVIVSDAAQNDIQVIDQSQTQAKQKPRNKISADSGKKKSDYQNTEPTTDSGKKKSDYQNIEPTTDSGQKTFDYQNIEPTQTECMMASFPKTTMGVPTYSGQKTSEPATQLLPSYPKTSRYATPSLSACIQALQAKSRPEVPHNARQAVDAVVRYHREHPEAEFNIIEQNPGQSFGDMSIAVNQDEADFTDPQQARKFANYNKWQRRKRKRLRQQAAGEPFGESKWHGEQ